jgi:hypothetical protein
MKKLNFIIVLFISIQVSLFAQKGEGGMWMPNTIKQVEADMQNMGMQINADAIWDTSKPSIKDAIVQLGNGCTAEVMSDKGLVFTNHHCGYDAIQKMSTIEHNYLDDGFWAKSFDEEMYADGLTVTFIKDIIDVTDVILAGVTDDMSAKERQSLVDKNKTNLSKSIPQDRFNTIVIKPFFKGNKYFVIKQEVFRDIRLVGTPPASLGKFGGDTDNWMWPRHTADFSIFRVYANAKNEPSDYSATNKPFKPKYSLKINLQDLKEDDFTMVMGFPGRTTEYLTSYAVEQIQNSADPAKVEIRQRTLAIMDKNMAKDKALKLKLASKHAGLANYWKFWIGESQGLKKFKAIEAKEAFEQDFSNRINANPKLKAKYGEVLPKLKALYAQKKPYVQVQSYASEIFSRNIDLPSTAIIIASLINRTESQGEAFYAKARNGYANYLLGQMKDFDANTDKEVFATLIDFYVKNVNSKYVSKQITKALKKQTATALANDLYANSNFTSEAKLKELFANTSFKDFKKAVVKDPAYKLFNAQQNLIDETISNPVNAINEQINDLMGKFMKAQMLVFTEQPFYPDANFTLRVAYGKVKGFKPRDGVFYEPFTHLSGVIDKHNPNDPEFILPEALFPLYKNKDYGQYASKDGTLVTDFLATNHITGGNSGSPILDKDGNHIGLAFDGVWEGVMEDVYYRPEIARSIHVKDNYVLFIIDKMANCQHIMNELTIVKSK